MKRACPALLWLALRPTYPTVGGSLGVVGKISIYIVKKAFSKIISFKGIIQKFLNISAVVI
jgi:hypothetical protein